MKKTKARVKFPQTKRSAVVIAILLLVCLGGAQFWFNSHIFNRVVKLDDLALKTLIFDAMNNLNKDAVVEPQSGKIYLPEARLVLPPYPQELSRGIMYSYSTASEGSHEELQIATKNGMSHGYATLTQGANEGKLFDVIPIAQACVRQVIITFKPVNQAAEPDYTYLGSQQLADGRTLELMLADKCPASSAELTNYIKQIQSY